MLTEKLIYRFEISNWYGITGKHFKLHKLYLTNRYQRTLLYNENGNITTSTGAKIEHGSPGVRFWDLCFSSYLQTTHKFVSDKSLPILSADDTNILLCHSYVLTVIAILTLHLKF
jgi:hypothetical protein